MDVSFWFDTINFEWPIVYNNESHVIIKFFSLKNVFDLAKIVDPDKCHVMICSRYALRSHKYKNVSDITVILFLLCRTHLNVRVGLNSSLLFVCRDYPEHNCLSFNWSPRGKYILIVMTRQYVCGGGVIKQIFVQLPAGGI